MYKVSWADGSGKKQLNSQQLCMEVTSWLILSLKSEIDWISELSVNPIDCDI